MEKPSLDDYRRLMGSSSAQREYDEFLQKVKQTVYIDNLSPKVTDTILKKAVEQFGTVENIQFIPNYLGPENFPQCALVEMPDAKLAKAVISVINGCPFMVSGAPRPVRARPAKKEMFADRPKEPGRRTEVRWLDPSDPDFEVAQQLKNLVKKHAAESSFLLENQLAEEEKLAKQQKGYLYTNYEKLEMIDKANHDVRKLGDYYRMNMGDDL